MRGQGNDVVYSANLQGRDDVGIDRPRVDVDEHGREALPALEQGVDDGGDFTMIVYGRARRYGGRVRDSGADGPLQAVRKELARAAVPGHRESLYRWRKRV